MVDLGETHPLRTENLPNLAVLDLLRISVGSLVQLRESFVSLRRVWIFLDDELHRSDAVQLVEELSAFVTSHPALQLLALEYPIRCSYDDEVLDPGWNDSLRALCDERGIVFACNEEMP